MTIRTLDLRTTGIDGFEFPRAATSFGSATAAAQHIIDDVRARGLDAVREVTARFDGVELESIAVPAEAISAAWEATTPELRDAITRSIERVQGGHAAQLPQPRRTEFAPGAVVEQRYLPVQRVGLYAPGGLAAYASSVIMNVVPAQVAGAPSIAVVSPPSRETGLPPIQVLAACAALGVTEVYAVGGAQAVAALAYGLPDAGGGAPLRPVDVITGPGNVFVAAAKSLVRDIVGIDSIAGPTEILVLADATADADLVAADLLSQAEHDPNAASVLVTDSAELAAAVTERLDARAAVTANGDRAREALDGEQSMIVLVADLDAGIALANRYGAEHLELVTADPRATLERITNAGAIFLGHFSPVSLGDYAAGSNHVLPTSGTSRFSSGLSVQPFLRPVQVIDYDEAALREIGDVVTTFADAEGLPAHGEAVTARTRRG
ncbi:histidinol dehydrogenase [Schumannella soli]|uniref:Histidinol dehydrogenase n=1 Tax=Schumannella soli TaxID=2590779 RepID=A0A506Y597_9MICO|nr:histidinol dehydrogenase [Schumannella soli]TPW75619.1 histidinol dehydrogenase [Schumannella soli]